MSIVDGYRLEPMVGDPDDHRPDTVWALTVDGAAEGPRVEDLAVIVERIAPGDPIPLHRHRQNEVVIVHGEGGVNTLGQERRTVAEGTVVYIPAGVSHGLLNTSDVPLPIEGVFPTTRIPIEYLERNPAPGTESDPPARPMMIDLRTGRSRPA